MMSQHVSPEAGALSSKSKLLDLLTSMHSGGPGIDIAEVQKASDRLKLEQFNRITKKVLTETG
jgi:hypothetical protein